VGAELLERVPSGLEESLVGDRVELAVYVDETTELELRAAYPSSTSEPVPDGWEDRWKDFHRPARAGGLWIGPPWIDPPDREPRVVVDPGRAFGTGAHPTTRASIELLASVARGSLLDAGCGSGVVAVAAVRLGFDPVYAVDLDPVAVEVARDVALSNSVLVEVAVADVLRDEVPRADVVVANIELRIVEALLTRTHASTAVTSGYYASDLPAATGWERVRRLELEGWAADVWAARH
jgi:ribosomal protein L11 methyltransferase